MNKFLKFVMAVLSIAIATGLVFVTEGSGTPQEKRPKSDLSQGDDQRQRLPKLIDLGAGKCIPCKKMAPILEEIKKEYRGVLDVEFIDVWKDPSSGRKYGIRIIPTQIFYDSTGKELTRHEGFMGKEDILNTFNRLGIKLEGIGRSRGDAVGVFSTLSRAIEGAPFIALAASFVWGILSIILSPCHLASIPLIVGFIDEQGRISTRRAFNLALLFAVGILITIGIIGAITAAAGRMMGDVGKYGNYFVAIIFIVVGLHLLGIISMPWSGSGRAGVKRKGYLAAFILGLVFGVALGPCTFAYMAPMLAVTFRLASSNLTYGLSLLLLYGIGHCSVIVAAGTFTEIVQHYLNWTDRSRGAVILKKVCGVLVIMGGFYLIYTTL